MTPKELLRKEIEQREESIKRLRVRTQELINELCKVQEKMKEASAKIYQYRQAISQIHEDD